MNNIIRTNVKILHNKEYNFLDVTFSGFISYEDLVEICEYEFQLIEHYKIRKCLINLREINIYPPGGEEFIRTCWFPRVIELEVKAIAFVVPDDVFAKISMQEAHDINIPVTVQHFMRQDEARQWLQSKLIDDDYIDSHSNVQIKSM